MGAPTIIDQPAQFVITPAEPPPATGAIPERYALSSADDDVVASIALGRDGPLEIRPADGEAYRVEVGGDAQRMQWRALRGAEVIATYQRGRLRYGGRLWLKDDNDYRLRYTTLLPFRVRLRDERRRDVIDARAAGDHAIAITMRPLEDPADGTLLLTFTGAFALLELQSRRMRSLLGPRR